jgi:acetyltransferase-like isoleucine patch superfamily enzyme
VIGHGVWFSCVGEIEIGREVMIGHDVLIADSFHEYADRAIPIVAQPMAEPRPVRLGSGSIVGPGAAILSGSQLGAGSYVAPNAVVAGEIPPHSVAAGNPAQVIRRWDPDRAEWVDSPDPRWSGVLSALTR